MALLGLLYFKITRRRKFSKIFVTFFSLRIQVTFPIVLPALILICVPIIGCVPTFDNFSENSNAPHKLKLSARPNVFILFDLQ